MKKSIVAAISIFIVTALIIACVWFFWYSPAADRGAPDQIVIGGPPLEQSAFLYIAEEQGFFTKNGLNVTIKDDYPSGVGPVSDMTAGRLDLSISAEYPFISALFNGANISTIGTIDRYQNEKIIGRKDRGILNISDLSGKRIGVPRGTIAEFFLGRTLDLHGLSLQDVTLADVPGPQSMDSLMAGDVDAVIAWQPHAYAIEDLLGDNGTILPAQSSQLLYTVMAGRKEWIADHQDQVTMLLRSLAEAEEYAIAHPAEAKEIVKKRLNYTDAYIATIWPDHQFSLTLDQSLVIAMNDEARWMINNNLTTAKTLPDFNDHVYTEGLAKVKPEAVNIR